MGNDQSSEGANVRNKNQNRNQNRNRNANHNDNRNHMPVTEVQEILNQQRQLYEQRLKELASQKNNAQAASATTSTDRKPAPYSYARDDLQNMVHAVNASTGPSSGLYPNLGTAPSNMGNETAPSASYTNRDEGFVFINDKPVTAATQRFQASAPPAGDVLGPNGRSQSRNRSQQRSNRDEDDKLSCPICQGRLGVEIYLCEGGHSACHECRARNAICSTHGCWRPIGNTRNRALEAYIAESIVPCRNENDGCKLSFKLAEIEIHQRECPFEEMQCPLTAVFNRCSWKGKLRQLTSHFDNVHREHRQANVDQEMLLFNICNDNRVVHLVELGNFVFLVHIRVSETDRLIYFTTKMIGTNHSANKWTYEFHVYNKREPRRKFQYNDICQSSSISFQEMFSGTSCAMLPLSYAMTFINEGALAYKFFIKKAFEHKKENNQPRGRGRRHQNRNNNS